MLVPVTAIQHYSIVDAQGNCDAGLPGKKKYGLGVIPDFFFKEEVIFLAEVIADGATYDRIKTDPIDWQRIDGRFG